MVATIMFVVFCRDRLAGWPSGPQTQPDPAFGAFLIRVADKFWSAHRCSESSAPAAGKDVFVALIIIGCDRISALREWMAQIGGNAPWLRA